MNLKPEYDGRTLNVKFWESGRANKPVRKGGKDRPDVDT
jgi:hypothetical protein